MQDTSLQFKTAIAQPSRKLRSRVSFPDTLSRVFQSFSLPAIETSGDYPYGLDDTTVKSIVLSDGLVFGSDFEIGGAPMAKVTIELIWEADSAPTYDFEGQECDVELGLMLPGGNVEYLSIGKFTVESAVFKKNMLTLKTSDRMYKAEKDYVSDILYPATPLDILESACDQAGLTLATVSFANDSYSVPNEPVFEGVTCRKVFGQVAELAGGYAVINRAGELEIRTLGTTTAREIAKEHYIDFPHDDVANSKIDKVIVSVGAEQAVAGTGDTIYHIVDNMFVQNPHNVVDAVYNVLGGLDYTAGTFTWQGDFSLDLGDKVTVDGHTMYILDRSLRYTGGLRETDKSPAASNIVKESTGKGNMTLEIERHKVQIKVLRDSITQTVERIDNLVVGANNRLLQSNTNIELDSDNAVVTQQFLNSQKPYYKATSSVPIELYGAFPNSQFAEPLGDLGESTVSIDVLTEVDSTVALDGKEYETQANRWSRIHVTKIFNQNTTKHIRHLSPYSRKNFRSKTVGTKLIDSLTADTNTLYYRNLKVERGTVMTEWSLTPEELEVNVDRLKSEIRQLADSITLLVSKNEMYAELQILANEISSKVEKDNVISEINQTAERIKIIAERISLVGAVEVLSDITGKLGEIVSGVITGATVRTSAGPDRIQLTNSVLEAYLNNVRRVLLDYDSLDFYNATGEHSGTLTGITYADDSIPRMIAHSKNLVEIVARANAYEYTDPEARIWVSNVGNVPDITMSVFNGIYSSILYLTDREFGAMVDDFNVMGNFTVTGGTKSAVVETKNYGSRKMYALETPDNRFVTYVETELEIGKHYIEIEPMFRQTISNYFVVPHIQNMAFVSIIERKDDGFLVLVEGDKSAEVVFEINGKRLGYEDIYMEEVIQGERVMRNGRTVQGYSWESDNLPSEQYNSQSNNNQYR